MVSIALMTGYTAQLQPRHAAGFRVLRKSAMLDVLVAALRVSVGLRR